MPSIDKDPGLQQAEKKILAGLTREQKKLFSLWFKIERKMHDIDLRQDRLYEQLGTIRDMILDNDNCEVNLSKLESHLWEAHSKIDAYDLKLEQEKEVLEGRFDEVLGQIKAQESEPAELTWYLWCKAGYTDTDNTRSKIRGRGWINDIHSTR